MYQADYVSQYESKFPGLRKIYKFSVKFHIRSEEVNSNLAGVLHANCKNILAIREELIGMVVDLVEIIKKDFSLGIAVMESCRGQLGEPYGSSFVEDFKKTMAVEMNRKEYLQKLINEKAKFSSIDQLNAVLSFLGIPYGIDVSGGAVNGKWVFSHNDTPDEAILTGTYNFRRNCLLDKEVEDIITWVKRIK